MNEGAMDAVAGLATVDYVIIVGFLVVVTIIGAVMSRAAAGGLDDYFLGGNKIPWWVLGASTATSNFDMSGTMIIVAVVFALGMKGFLVEIRGGVGMSLAFLMVFLGKWLRRSRVMTSAEWMKIRFGMDRQGRLAHLLSAIANIVLSLGMIIYFAKGAGKFLTHFLPLSEISCTSIMVGVGLAYTLMSGLYGVVFTDLVQMVLLTFTAIYVSVQAFTLRGEITLPKGFLSLDLEVPQGLGQQLLAKDPANWQPIFDMFGICVVIWVVRTTLEGMSGIGGYTDQRFFASRNEREAGLLTFESIILSIFRWTMVAGLVVMGYSLVQKGAAGAEMITKDPEQVLPVVLGQYLPAGVRGVVIAGLIAAAMSTFDSTLNAGASYVVKDVYETYINPEATGKQLMSVSRWATIGLCVAGISLAGVVPNINKIWGLITMGLGAGLFMPLFLRWYWPRFNGYGFAAGTAAGIAAGLTINGALGWPLYYAFPTVIGIALVVCVSVALMTPAVDDDVLVAFWTKVNPWGLWGRIGELARERGEVGKTGRLERLVENLNDLVAVAFAVPFQICTLLAGMAFIFHDWKKFAFMITASLFSGIGLYFMWFRNLKSDEECAADDAKYAPQRGEDGTEAGVEPAPAEAPAE